MDINKSELSSIATGPRLLCIGSVNIDEVYTVKSIVKEGETKSSKSRNIIAGGKAVCSDMEILILNSCFSQNISGKGANLSVAGAKAGADVYLGAKIGQDGQWIRDLVSSIGVNTSMVITTSIATGRAIIQVEEQSGENCILLFDGANHSITRDDVVQMCEPFNRGDWLAIQNEGSEVCFTIAHAIEKGMKVLWNPAPMEISQPMSEMIPLVDVIVVNESEFRQMYAWVKKDLPEKFHNEATVEAEERLLAYAKQANVKILIMTRGAQGSVAVVRNHKADDYGLYSVPCGPVSPESIKDTTSAGDTWIGFFLASIIKSGGKEAQSLSVNQIIDAMKVASYASGIGITRNGAIPSIPSLEEVETCMATGKI
ncbi:putative ribokinase [Mycoemilia scoparia]|uniref:Ribokinase n=1 Tax=Mycoemilia scoparia TaxID=417184 RepID=A0A9W8A3P7_9FUNG|nr:putative ribokinase [Mycoemilia scoparia]